MADGSCEMDGPLSELAEKAPLTIPLDPQRVGNVAPRATAPRPTSPEPWHSPALLMQSTTRRSSPRAARLSTGSPAACRAQTVASSIHSGSGCRVPSGTWHIAYRRPLYCCAHNPLTVCPDRGTHRTPRQRDFLDGFYGEMLLEHDLRSTHARMRYPCPYSCPVRPTTSACPSAIRLRLGWI